MRYISVFSGIEAASVAWGPLGFEPVAFAEIDKFPSAVLAHRFPQVPNLGDMTKADWSVYAGAVDIVIGGSPCQSFSVAGLRKGLDDPRGNLMLEYLRVCDVIKPKWIVWENVPGVLSSGGGRDFGALLGALVQLGYGFAYRVLDAQHFGTAQRRRRVYLVGCRGGDWRSAASVLFERRRLPGNTTAGGQTQKNNSANTQSNIVTYRESGFGQFVESKQAGTLCASGGCLGGGSESLIADTTNKTLRRLMPDEADALQGFPRGWTRIPYRGKSAEECPDGPRYKACGNSMAVPVVRWVGQGIKDVEDGGE